MSGRATYPHPGPAGRPSPARGEGKCASEGPGDGRDRPGTETIVAASDSATDLSDPSNTLFPSLLAGGGGPRRSRGSVEGAAAEQRTGRDHILQGGALKALETGDLTTTWEVGR